MRSEPLHAATIFSTQVEMGVQRQWEVSGERGCEQDDEGCIEPHIGNDIIMLAISVLSWWMEI